MLVKDWKAVSDDEMSKEAILALHQPSSAYRVSEYSYEPGAKIKGAMQAGTCYVLQGVCRFTADESVSVKAGQFVSLPRGEHNLEILKGSPAVLVFAWELPRL